jgi:signal transduction histidine kinase
MQDRISVLQVEDDPRDAELVLSELLRSGLDVRARRVASSPEFAAALAEGPWDIILCDFRIPGFGAFPAYHQLRRSGYQIPFIVVTGTLNEETAVECLKTGIDDYILKENLARLGPAVRQAIQIAEERRRSRLLEEEVRQAQKMEAVGRLAGGVAHDFNNLLTVIFANTARLRSTIPAGAGGELDAIEEAARQAKSVTNSLLTLCHKAETRRTPVDAAALVRDAARLLARVLPAAIEMKIETPDRPLWVSADATQLHQVLMNLAINARDAMPAGGVLRFEARPARGPEREPPGGAGPALGVAMIVEDTGTGMTGEVAARAFEPFFTTKPRGQGTGLGLSVVHGIIADHGGKIDLSSRPGAGTRLAILLPAAEAPAACAEAAAPVAAPHAGGGLVIIAEDNNLIRGLLAATLQGMGYTTVEAADGAAALDAVKRHDVALVVLDLDLPKLNGSATLDELSRRTQPPPALVITGSPHFDPPDAPWISLLSKPFTIDEFRRAVIGLTEPGAASSGGTVR